MNGSAARIGERFRSLSTRERILLLSCAAVVSAFLAVRWLVFPAVAGYRRDLASIPALQARLARYRVAAAGSDRIDEALAEAVDRLETLEEGLLSGDGPSAAGVDLQGLLKPMIDRPDTRVTSVRGLPPVAAGAYSEVAVQVDLQTTTEGLASFLSAVPRSPKRIRVRKLSVNSGFYNPAAATRRETLVVSVVVAGLARAPADDKSGAAQTGGGE